MRNNILYVIFAFFMLGGLIAAGFLGPFLQHLLMPWTIYKEQVEGATEIVEKTYDADNAIYNYEWFKTQQNKILQVERQIEISIQERNDFLKLYPNSTRWTEYQQGEYSRLSANIAGQKQLYEKLVADYNARSEMANRAIFKEGLPLRIEKRLWI